jgi:hypothetical protein
LTARTCSGTKVADLTPLRGIPLKQLWCDINLAREAAFLRSAKTLEMINGKSAAPFWAELDAKKP